MAVITEPIFICWVFIGIISFSVKSQTAATVLFAILFCPLESTVFLFLRLPLKRSGASFTDEFDPVPPKQTKEEDPQRGKPWSGNSSWM